MEEEDEEEERKMKEERKVKVKKRKRVKAVEVAELEATATMSANGTVGAEGALKFGSDASRSSFVGLGVGGPLGTSPTATSTGPGSSRMGRQKMSETEEEW